MQMITDMTAVNGEPLINFKQRTTEANYVNVISDINKGCFSMIGMMGGPQALSLAPGCLTTDIVAHEFIHVLGIKYFFLFFVFNWFYKDIKKKDFIMSRLGLIETLMLNTTRKI